MKNGNEQESLYKIQKRLLGIDGAQPLGTDAEEQERAQIEAMTLPKMEFKKKRPGFYPYIGIAAALFLGVSLQQTLDTEDTFVHKGDSRMIPVEMELVPKSSSSSSLRIQIPREGYLTIIVKNSEGQFRVKGQTGLLQKGSHGEVRSKTTQKAFIFSSEERWVCALATATQEQADVISEQLDAFKESLDDQSCIKR